MTEFRRPLDDVYAAGQPAPGELASLARDGVRTVINLRAANEPVDYDEEHEVQRLGMRYVAVPVAGAEDLTQATVQRFSTELEQARRLGSVLVHCASANRVGALLALDRGLTRGAPDDEALALGRAAGLDSLEPVVTQMLSSSHSQRP